MRQLSLWLVASLLLCAFHTPSEAKELKFIEPPGAYRYAASLPDEDPGFRLVAKSYVEDMDPSAEPGPRAQYLRLEATPGEYEPASFVIYATCNLSQLDISVSALKNESGVPIPASAIEVSRVVRSPVRDVYNGPPDQIEIVNRFLARSKPLDLPKSEFREIWLTLQVPEDAAPGAYAGEVKVRSGDIEGSLGLYVRVLPFKLVEPKDKSLGLYYADRQMMETNPHWLRRDLANMRAHGVRNVRTNLAIHYRREADGTIVPNTTQLETFLTLYREMDFRSIIFYDNFNGSLARMTGHGDYVKMMMDEDTETAALPRGYLGRALAKDPAYRAAVRRALEAFGELQRKFPELDLYLQHMDEVFGHEPHLDLYCEITQIAREEMQGVGQFYITFHTTKEKYEEWRKTIAPYVDLRNYAGYPFEWWLARGHTMDEKRRELAASGDKAWFYHNFIWRAWNPEWSRIINGLFLWVSPFEVHCPDCEQWIARPGRIGNPYDETTGRSASYAMFLPDPEDPDLLVPTLLWECAREGFDDVRYFATLESLIQEKSDRKPAEAAKAKQFLARLRAVVEEARQGKPKPKDAALCRPGEIDLETPLLYDRPRGDETGGRSPLIGALAMRFTGQDWHTIRSKVIEHILALRE
jgi:hypothetical protein